MVTKRKLPHEPLPEIEEGRLEATEILLKIKEGRLNLYSSYILPRNKVPKEQLQLEVSMQNFKSRAVKQTTT